VVDFFKNNRRMAFILMESLASAVKGLCACHGVKLHPYALRVNFSQKTPENVQSSVGRSGAEGATNTTAKVSGSGVEGVPQPEA
jgi:hypothetical protein